MLNTILVQYEFLCNFPTTDKFKIFVQASFQDEDHSVRSVMWSTFSKYSLTCMHAISVVEQNPTYIQAEVKLLSSAYQTTQGCKFLS